MKLENRYALFSFHAEFKWMQFGFKRLFALTTMSQLWHWYTWFPFYYFYSHTTFQPFSSNAADIWKQRHI